MMRINHRGLRPPRLAGSLLLAFALSIILAACGMTPVMQGRKLVDEGQYDEARRLLYAEVDSNPENALAWRELGRAYFKEDEFDKAEVCFANAASTDPLSRWYIGLIQEERGQPDLAIETYIAALQQFPSGNTKALIRKRLDDLLRKELERRLPKLAREEEAAIEASEVPENTVAVLKFDGTRLSEEVAPIAYGLADFVAADLAKVKSLRSVERLKIEAILQERRLKELGYVDTLSAVQSGRLIGARRVVTGQLVSLGEDIQIGGVVVDIVQDAASRTAIDQTDVDKIFSMQKRFVFALLDSLGVTLTAEERDAIEEVPTEDYLAFLAYCRGLQYRDQGHLRMAQSEFQSASQIDGGFIKAAAEASETDLLIMGRELGPATISNIEAVAGQEFPGGLGAGQIPGGLERTLRSLIDDSGANATGEDEADDGNTDTEKDPVVRATGSAKVIGNLDGD